MNPRNLAQAKNPDLYNSYVALRRAARLAREKAIQTDTGIVVRRNGKTTHVSARELRQRSEGSQVRSATGRQPGQ